MAEIVYDIIPEPDVTPTLNKRLVTYLAAIFPEWADVFKKRRAWHDAAAVWTTLARDKEKIVGHIGVVERTVTTCWNWRYNVASFQGVSVLSDYRGRGIGRTLLAQSLDEARRRNYPFAILFCTEPLVPFYSALGWKLPDDSMIMWRDRALPIPMRSNCPMYQELGDLAFPEGPIDVHNPLV